MCVEVFAQLPLFIAGAYAFAARKEWIRTPALMYSISTVATMVRNLMPADGLSLALNTCCQVTALRF